VADVPGALEGARYLRVAEDPHDGTPQAYVAFIEGLQENDTVSASFWGYDTTPGASPSMRIWGHYAFNGDVNSYDGSASGNSTYTGTAGEPQQGDWWQVGHTWTVAADKEALVVEVRLYSTPSTSDPNHTDYFVDLLEVTTSSSTATITFAPEPASLAILGLGGLVAIRRRKH
jgi:hypothetical protein